MKKKIMLLISAVIVLALLLGVYFIKASRDKQTEANDDADTKTADELLSQTGIKLTDIKEDDIKNISLKKGDAIISLEKTKGNWVSSDYPDYTYNANTMQSIVYCFTGLYASNTVTENADSLEKYGLDNPTVIGTSTDKKGNVQTICLGTTTPDGNYYYAKVNDDNAVYIIDSLYGKSLCCEYDDLIDKSIAKIDKTSVTKLELKRKGEDDVLVVFDKEDETAEDYHNTIGLAALTMKKPIENMVVYPYNLESSVLYNSSSIAIGKLADISPANLADYGLASPDIEVSIEDIDGNAISFKVGNKAESFKDEETEYYYAMFDDKPQVFTIDERAVKPFREAKIIDFIQNFITIHKRSDVNKIEISSDKTSFDIDFKEEGDNKFTTDSDGTKRDNRNTYINGTLVDRDTFSDFYEQICNLSFDDLDENAKASGSPAVTISFKLSDGSEDKAEYYNYNENFYCVKKGEDCSMLINKQAVKKLLEDAEKLSSKG
jgi:hypothetical protein